jgi:quercetin dioxygenase-like cupin family protein
MSVLLLIAAAATPAAPAVIPPALPASVTRAEMDVLRDHGDQQVLVQSRQIPAGESSGWHIHPGVEISSVISGVTEVTIGSAPPHRVAAGETVVIPRGVAHKASAIGTAPADLLLTFVVDKGAPLRTPVSAPEK